MKDLSTADMLIDDIAAHLDAALSDPSRAPHVRAVLRRRLAAMADAHPAHDEADAEDLWDNVPI